MKANLVCKGGGVTGIALVGAVNYLEELGYSWNQLAGTSAGAIVASLLAVGYSGNELKEIILNLNYKKFNDKNKLQSIPIIGQSLSLFFNKGLYSGKAIENFLTAKFKAKGKTKFIDISKNGVSKLKMIAADINRKKLLILPDDLIDYNIDPLNFEISKAVRMSISIPFYYNPVTLKIGKEKKYIVDGGIASNFPIWIFDIKDSSSFPTFGLNLKKDDTCISPFKCRTLIPYMLNVIDTALYTDEIVYVKNKNLIKQIDIPTFRVKPTDFHLNKKTVLKLYKSGYYSAKHYIDSL